MMRFVLMAMTLSLLMACHSATGSDKQSFVLQGAWTLQQVEYPYGRTDTFSMRQGMPLRLYEGDSVIYSCMVVKTETGLIVRHSMQNQVTLIGTGNGGYVYLEDSDPRPLTIVNDSTIVIQRNGALSTWHRADDITQEWGPEIKDIITADLQRTDENSTQSYVLSAKERRQADVIHIFIIATIAAIILLLLIARIAVQNRRAKQRLQLQLQQIQEVRQERPQTVRQAIETVETAFFASDDYDQLQHRITNGQRLKEADWQEIEGNVRKVYPGFISQLRGLYTMSELEYQVCLLIKLRIAPSDIAAVLARDVSTISTVRSRLYKKVFGQKGGSREWDEFILSIGG
ncbi:MAG: hypothetical protein IJQ76_04020 [Prevotella sp.]|nr:hypothetical protein [Prevotella sp.]